MGDYAHSTIHINNREVILADILSSKATSLSSFESSTFEFIKEWLNNTESFKLNTSGSTGTPKEITLTRNQLKQSATRTLTALELNQSNTAIICLDTKYIAGKMMLVRALEGDMKIIAIEPSSNPLTNLSTEINNSLAAFVPLQLQEMLADSENIKKLNQFNVIIVGGGSVNAKLLQQIQKISCPVFATYGMTETVSHIALQRLNGEKASDHFSVLSGIKIQLDDRGCLVIQMPEFSETIVTNDLVELIGPDQFRWLGRYDNVINSGGFKISPEKIEKVLEQNILTDRSFFVAGIPDDRLGEKLILIIEGAETKIDLSKITDLHAYEFPKEIRFLRGFVRSDTGKILRQQTKLLANS